MMAEVVLADLGPLESFANVCRCVLEGSEKGWWV
jgi:hypothetical protein